MKKQRRTMNRKSLLLLLVLLTAVVMLATGCQSSPKKEEINPIPTAPPVATEILESEEKPQEEIKQEEVEEEATEAPIIIEKEVGEGAVSFSFQVTFKDGTSNYYKVHTDEKTVGEALLRAKLIEGSQGEFGLYVLTVDGETLDFDKDKMYWAFYVNGQYATAGVDQTDIEADALYQFKAEK